MTSSPSSRPSSKSSKGLPTLEQVRTEKAERSLHSFLRQAWPVLEPSTPFVDSWHIGVVCEHLQAVSAGQIHDLIINVPPRTLKSRMVSVAWPMWEWIAHPSTRWLFASYAAVLSTRDSLACRRLIESNWYQGRWADKFQLTSDQNVKNRFENDQAGYRIATSVEGVATGDGGDIIVVDDPHSAKEIHSEAKREAVLEWWDQTMSTRRNDPKTGRRVIVMQRLHEKDLTGHIIAKNMGWEHLCLPMEYDVPKARRSTSLGNYDKRTEAGELLCPDRFGPKEVASLKTELGSFGASGQLQQQPAPAGGGIFQRKHWRYYTVLPERLDRIICSWDMAFKDLKDSDYVVGQAWGVKGADKYLLDQVRDQMGFGASVQAVRQLKAKFAQAVAVLVEDKANGTAVLETLQREIPGIIAVNPEGGKIARAYAIQPQHEAGNIWIPDPTIAPWIGDYVNRFSLFPAVDYDDEIDATTQAVNWLGGTNLHQWERLYG